MVDYGYGGGGGGFGALLDRETEGVAPGQEAPEPSREQPRLTGFSIGGQQQHQRFVSQADDALVLPAAAIAGHSNSPLPDTDPEIPEPADPVLALAYAHATGEAMPLGELQLQGLLNSDIAPSYPLRDVPGLDSYGAQSIIYTEMKINFSNALAHVREARDLFPDDPILGQGDFMVLRTLRSAPPARPPEAPKEQRGFFGKLFGSREKKAKGKAKGKPKGKEGTDGEGNGEEALERTTDGGGSGEAEGDCPEAGEEKAKKSGFSFRSVFRRDTEVEVAPVEPPEESESSASPREAGEDGDPDRGAKDKDKDKEKGKKGRSSLFGSVFGRHPSPPALRDADHAGPLSESRGSVGNLSAGELGEQPAGGEGERSPEESPPTKSEKGKKEKFSLLSVFSLSSSPKRPEGEEPAAAAKKKDKAKGGAALL